MSRRPLQDPIGVEATPTKRQWFWLAAVAFGVGIYLAFRAEEARIVGGIV